MKLFIYWFIIILNLFSIICILVSVTNVNGVRSPLAKSTCQQKKHRARANVQYQRSPLKRVWIRLGRESTGRPPSCAMNDVEK